MILVTGGTGLVGSHLICELLKSGNDVRALKRNTSDLANVRRVFSNYFENSEEVFSKVEWVECDILDITGLETAMEGIDHVYHCAALVSFDRSEKKNLLKINIEGAANIVNIAIEKNVRKLCYVSSIAALGRAENNNIITEDTHWKTSKENSHYAISKYGGEREVWRGIKEGLDAVIVNPSVILGTSGKNNMNNRLITTVWKGLKLYTNGINGFVDVKDVVRPMIQLMQSDIVNERFILNSENLSYREFFTMLSGFLGKKPPNIHASLPVQEIAWRLLKIFSIITGTKPFITKEIARTSRNQSRYSNEKIRKAIGYKFIPVGKSLRELAQEFAKDKG